MGYQLLVAFSPAARKVVAWTIVWLSGALRPGDYWFLTE
jgi:hypothetical protein